MFCSVYLYSQPVESFPIHLTYALQIFARQIQIYEPSTIRREVTEPGKGISNIELQFTYFDTGRLP
jgi:hypothetical protein